MRTTILITLLVAAAANGCDATREEADASSPTASSSTASSSTASSSTASSSTASSSTASSSTASSSTASPSKTTGTPSSGPRVDLQVHLSSTSDEPFRIAGAQAFAYPNRNEIAFVDAGVKASCEERPYAFGGDLGAHAAFVLRLGADPSTSEPIPTGYTVYYPKDGKTTNSGNATSGIDLTFSRVDDEMWAGKLSGTISANDTIEGTFRATVCK